MTRVFISGPMTGYENYNRDKFFAAEDLLEGQGLEVYNPAYPNSDFQDNDWNSYVKLGIKNLLACDQVYVLAGWQESKGSLLEVTVAEALGMPIQYEVPGDKEVFDRDRVLDTAKNIINHDRNDSYGTAKESFSRISDLWTVYLGKNVYPWDVANMMILLKVSRLANSEDHIDSWVDIAGYAALGCEVVQ